MRHAKLKERASGFSLLELMIALGILGITSLLIGTAFLAGGMEHKRSVNETVGAVVAENARSICAVALEYPRVAAYWQSLPDPKRLCFYDVTPLLSHLDRAYPTLQFRKMPQPSTDPWDDYSLEIDGRYYRPMDWHETRPGTGEFVPSSRYGWLALLKHQFPQGWTPDQALPRSCEIVILVYRRHLGTDDPDRDFVLWGGVVIDERIQPPATDIGAPVILQETGQHAFTVDDEGALDRPLPNGAAVALEYTRGNESPVIACQKYQIVLGD